MLFDALNIGATSLKANQKAIDVVSHNIANVNTPGYSKQTSNLVTARPDQINGLNLGRGVSLQSIQRSIDPLINNAQINNASQLAYWTQQNSGLNAVENVFGSLQSTGLSAAFNDFFLAWQHLANNPQDGAQRVNVQSKAAVIVANLTNMNSQISKAQLAADSQIDQNITNANTLLDQIGVLSQEIQRQESAAKGAAGLANDLRDQRDQAVRDLAKIIPVQSIGTANGTFILQSTSGDLLSQDGVSQHLARGNVGAGGFADVVIQGSGVSIANASTGGNIGGLIDLRDNKLGNYLKQMDSIANNLIFATNQLHANGTGASGKTTLTAGQASNTALALNDPAQAAPFAAKVQAGSFRIHTYDATGAAVPAGGTLINITATSTMTSVATSINAVPNITATVDASGRLTISAAAGTTFRLSDDTSNMLAAYEINTFFHGSSSSNIQLSSDVLNDANAINTGKVNPTTSIASLGDNSTATAILGLQDLALSVDGTAAASLHQRTSSLATQYGTDVAVSKQQLDYRTAESQSLSSQRQAISGVNVDEELISMIKYQRAYEASSKIISTTNQMLNSLMGLIR